MKRIIIDTNFLLIPGQFGIDIFAEIDRLMKDLHEVCIVAATTKELAELAKGKGKDAMAARLAEGLCSQKSLKSLDSSASKADDAIVELSNRDVYVATQDKALRERVRAKGAKIISMRQKRYLVVI